MLKITIPDPCHENWDQMSANPQGRHCSSCAKTVIDFTQMTDDEVKGFLMNKKQERICGRFSSTQLQQINIELPQNIFQLTMPVWKQFLVASLLVFSTTLFSCEANTQGEIVSSHKVQATTAVLKTNTTDTLPPKIMVGQPIIKKPVKCTTTVNPDKALMGDIAVLPESQTPRKLIGEVSVTQPKDTIVPKKDEPIIMGKMMATPVKKNLKKY